MRTSDQPLWGRFFLLVHPLELNKATNTGHLLLTGLPGSDYAVWSRVEPPVTLLERMAEPCWQPYLLFPEDVVKAAVEVIAAEQLPQQYSSSLSLSPRTPLFILLDGTWQQARKMYRQSPYLQRLPLVSLSPARNSQYHLRRNQQSGHLSTAEVAAELLFQLGQEVLGQRLQAHLQLFLRHYEASRSNHAL